MTRRRAGPAGRSTGIVTDERIYEGSYNKDEAGISYGQPAKQAWFVERDPSPWPEEL